MLLQWMVDGINGDCSECSWKESTLLWMLLEWIFKIAFFKFWMGEGRALYKIVEYYAKVGIGRSGCSYTIQNRYTKMILKLGEANSSYSTHQICRPLPICRLRSMGLMRRPNGGLGRPSYLPSIHPLRIPIPMLSFADILCAIYLVLKCFDDE